MFQREIELLTATARYSVTFRWLERSELNGDIRQSVFTFGPASSLSRTALAEKYGGEDADFLLEHLAGLTCHYQRLAFIDTAVPTAAK